MNELLRGTGGRRELGGGGICELSVSSKVHPAFLNSGAEAILRDAGSGGGGAKVEVDEEMEGRPSEDPIGRVLDDEAADAQPSLLLPAD